MFTKTTFALAFVLVTASGTLAATTNQGFAPRNDMYGQSIYVGTDPDANVRFELHRDTARGNAE
jgi:hypothetical protein